MRNVTLAATQFASTHTREGNLAKAEAMVRAAAAKGAQVILLQELFEGDYFCQVENYDYLLTAEEPSSRSSCPSHSSRRPAPPASTPSASSTRMGKSSASTARPTFPPAPATRRSSTSAPATPASRSSTPPTAASAWPSAGTSGSPSAPASWLSRAPSF